MSTELRDFLEIPYAQLEEMNLAAKAQRVERVPNQHDRPGLHLGLEQRRRQLWNATAGGERVPRESTVQRDRARQPP